MTWIKFHGELRQGKHRGIPRALRFVFLELSLLARPGRGELELPMGMKLLDGVHDLLGGGRREVELALELYTAGPDSKAPSLLVEGEEGAWRLKIPSWEKDNQLDSSAGRMRRLRENRALRNDCDASRDVTVTDAVRVTRRHARHAHGPSRDVTAADSSNAHAGASDPDLDLSQLSQSRDPDPDSPVAPPGGQTTPGEQGALPGIEAPPTVGKRRKRAKAESGPSPEGWQPDVALLELGVKLGFSGERVREEAPRFLDHHRSKGNVFSDWDAAFRTWIRNEAKWERERAERGRGAPIGARTTGARQGLGDFAERAARTVARS